MGGCPGSQGFESKYRLRSANYPCDVSSRPMLQSATITGSPVRMSKCTQCVLHMPCKHTHSQHRHANTWLLTSGFSYDVITHLTQHFIKPQATQRVSGCGSMYSLTVSVAGFIISSAGQATGVEHRVEHLSDEIRCKLKPLHEQRSPTVKACFPEYLQ